LTQAEKNKILKCERLVCIFRFLFASKFLTSLLALSLLVISSTAGSATLAQIKKRGEIIVGVKTDYPPFGQLTPDGQMQGLEHDLAQDLASRIGVKLKRVSVTGGNRLQKLEEGTVDILIATLGDTAERRQVSALIEPGYYESGATLLSRPLLDLNSWQDLQGKTVCISQGGYFNAPMAQMYLFTPLTFDTPSQAKLALRDGRCVGYLYDNIAAWADLQKPEWSGYQITLPAEKVVTWAIAMPRTAHASGLEKVISDSVVDWHRSGFLLALEKKWRLPASPYLAKMHTLWSQKSVDGKSYICTKNNHGQWPVQCQRNTLVASHAQESTALRQIGLDIKELSSIDLSFIYDDYDRQRFLAGLKGTVLLMLSTLVLSLLLGMGGAFVVESKQKIFKKLVQFLSVYAGMTPPLLQIYLLLFGVGSLLKELFELQLSTWLVVVFCLSLYTASSVMRAILESCIHLRRSTPIFHLRMNSHISIAKAYEGAAGSISASLVNVAKASMIASAVAVPELLSASTSIMLDSGNVSEMMNALLLSFVLLIAVTNRLIKALENKLREKAAQLYE
jgi:polar amino acid transport system substrate-binding protein